MILASKSKRPCFSSFDIHGGHFNRNPLVGTPGSMSPSFVGAWYAKGPYGLHT